MFWNCLLESELMFSEEKKNNIDRSTGRRFAFHSYWNFQCNVNKILQNKWWNVSILYITFYHIFKWYTHTRCLVSLSFLFILMCVDSSTMQYHWISLHIIVIKMVWNKKKSALKIINTRHKRWMWWMQAFWFKKQLKYESMVYVCVCAHKITFLNAFCLVEPEANTNSKEPKKKKPTKWKL